MSSYCNYQHRLHHSVSDLPEVNLVGESHIAIYLDILRQNDQVKVRKQPCHPCQCHFAKKQFLFLKVEKHVIRGKKLGFDCFP